MAKVLAIVLYIWVLTRVPALTLVLYVRALARVEALTPLLYVRALTRVKTLTLFLFVRALTLVAALTLILFSSSALFWYLFCVDVLLIVRALFAVRALTLAYILNFALSLTKTTGLTLSFSRLSLLLFLISAGLDVLLRVFHSFFHRRPPTSPALLSPSSSCRPTRQGS